MKVSKTMVKVSRKAPKETIKKVKKVIRKSINNSKDASRSKPETLVELAALKTAKRKKKVRSIVSIRIQPEILEKYRALGRGFSGIMADILRFAIDNPEILNKVKSIKNQR